MLAIVLYLLHCANSRLLLPGKFVSILRAVYWWSLVYTACVLRAILLVQINIITISDRFLACNLHERRRQLVPRYLR